MNLGEFRKATAHLPDDAVVLIEAEEHLQYNECEIRWLLEPVLDHSWAILIEPGVIVNYENDLDVRIDGKLGL